MPDLSPLLKDERKSDFGGVRSVDDPTWTSAANLAVMHNVQPVW